MGDPGDPSDPYLKAGIIPPFYKTAMLRAAEEGNALEVQGFLDVGTDPNTKDDFGRTILHIAAISGKVEVIQSAIQFKGINLGAKDVYGRTPLQIAESIMEDTHPDVVAGKQEIVKLLAK